MELNVCVLCILFAACGARNNFVPHSGLAKSQKVKVTPDENVPTRSYTSTGAFCDMSLCPIEGERRAYLAYTLNKLIHPRVPNIDQRRGSSEVVICPRLEELREIPYIMDVIGMAAARASAGPKLKSVKIVKRRGLVYPQTDVVELKKHAVHVECYGASDDGDSGDEDEED